MSNHYLPFQSSSETTDNKGNFGSVPFLVCVFMGCNKCLYLRAAIDRGGRCVLLSSYLRIFYYDLLQQDTFQKMAGKSLLVPANRENKENACQCDSGDLSLSAPNVSTIVMETLHLGFRSVLPPIWLHCRADRLCALGREPASTWLP